VTVNHRLSAFGLGLGALFLVATLSAEAQDPAKPAGKTEKAPATKKRVSDPSRRVPDYFDQVGLTPEQRESVYKIRAKYQPKIADLQKQLASAQAEMLTECETVLTEPQKQVLAGRRAAAKSKAEADRKKRIEAKAAKDAAKAEKDGAKASQ
jgi:hypothetical protein